MPLRIRLLFMYGCYICFAACTPKAAQDEEDNPTATKASVESPLSLTVDTAYLNTLLKEGEKLADSHPDSAIAIYKQVLHLSKANFHFNYAAAAYGNLSYCFKQKGDIQLSEDYLKMGIAYLQNAISLPEVRSNPEVQKKIYPKLAQFLQWQALPLESIEAYRTAQSFYNLKDTAQVNEYADMTSKMADGYFQLGQYDSAAALYFDISPLLTPVNKTNYKTAILVQIGLAATSARLAKPELALYYFQKSQMLASQFNDSSMYINVLTNLGSFYLEEASFDSAKAYAIKALNLSNALTSDVNTARFGQFQNAYTISATMMQSGQPVEALPYSKLLLKSAMKQHAKNNLIQAYYILGSNYLRLDKYHNAEKFLNKGLKLAQEAEKNENISALYGQLGMTYAAMGNYQQAYIYKSKYITLKDSFRSQENAARFDELNAKYNLLQKDKLLADQQISIERQQKLKSIWIGSTVALSLLLLVLIWNRRHKQTIAELKANLAGEEKERERIAQELHDGIVSRLSVIQTRFSALPQNNPGQEKAYQDVIGQLDQSIREIRNTSQNLLPEPLRHADLECILQLYCERINASSLLEVSLQLLDQLPEFTDEFKLNIYRIIQELIQNIIKHAGATTALIQLSIEDQQLELTVEDNGTEGNWEHRKDKGKGSGLKNLQNRIRLLQGHMEVEHDRQTSVYLYFPLKPHLAANKKK